jgi:ribosomal protein L21E
MDEIKVGDQVKILASASRNNIPIDTLGRIGKVLAVTKLTSFTAVQVETPKKKWIINAKYLQVV